MSVINKMLRDLDQRQDSNPSSSPFQRPLVAPELQRGIHSVPVNGSTRSVAGPARRWGWALAALAVVGAVGGATWWAGLWHTVETPVAPPLAAVVPVVPAPAVAASEPLVVTAPLPAEVASVAPVSVIPAPTPAPVAESTPALAPAPVVVAMPATTAATPRPVPSTSRRTVDASMAPIPATSLRMEPMLPPRKAHEAVLSGSAAPVGRAAGSAPEAASPTQRQQQASTDALSQAQSLWNSGNHAQALDLMQQSVDAAERAVKAGTSAVGNPVLLSLVRESVRMQMAQSGFAAVWDLLARLEPVLGNAPDLWALRGNTAQRLGRHQDSVNAYRMALQSNPNEQRWLLGSAVSLAALGQTSQAADMAERARSVGEISREVQAYLRQLGVPLKDK